MGSREIDRFMDALASLSGSDIEKVALGLDSDALCDEVDWWRATIAIDLALRRNRKSRIAACAARAARAAVLASAVRAGRAVDETEVVRVANAASDVARGFSGGATTRSVVQLLLESWAPVYS